MKVNNLPTDYRDYDYTVIHMVDGEAWYYGSWYKFEGAVRQATECGGHVIPTIEIEADTAKPTALDNLFSESLDALDRLTAMTKGA